VQVDAYGRDQHRRVLAVLWDEQIKVNLLLVAMGYAEVYRGAPCLVYCEHLQATEAKAAGPGGDVGVGGELREPPRLSTPGAAVRAVTHCASLRHPPARTMEHVSGVEEVPPLGADAETQAGPSR